MEPGDRVVGAQLLAISGLAWPGRARWPLPRTVAAGAALAGVAGAALAAAGLAAQGPQLTPRVTPPPSAALLTTGAYGVSRHPVYAGLLVGGAGWAVLRRRPEPVVSWAALAAVLHVKTRMEEKVLRARFGEAYEQYAATTPRLLGLGR